MSTLNTNLNPENQEGQANNSKNTFLEKVGKLKVVISAAVSKILLFSGVATALEKVSKLKVVIPAAVLGILLSSGVAIA
jgi:hypothetical protein